MFDVKPRLIVVVDWANAKLDLENALIARVERPATSRNSTIRSGIQT